MRANPLQEPLEGVGRGNRDFLGPDMAKSEASAIWAQKCRDFQGPPIPMALVMVLFALKSSKKSTDTLVT